MTTVATTYDAVLLDLDGTVYQGHEPIPGAIDAINALTIPACYVTNNASRTAADVATQLTALGLTATADDVFTSAHAGIHLLRETIAGGSTVLVVGTDALAQLVAESGFVPTRSADDKPAAVIHGHNTDTGWAILSEAALAIRAGAVYIATNVDATIPKERGLMVGNGSMVAAVTNATGVTPRSAGKPQPWLFTAAAAAHGATRPLAIGDRLDTDIAGGIAAGMDTLHVLTGVNGPADVLAAQPAHRPTFIADDLTCLAAHIDTWRPQPSGGFTAELRDNTITLSGGNTTSTFIDAVKTILHTSWQQHPTSPCTPAIRAASPAAEKALEQWW